MNEPLAPDAHEPVDEAVALASPLPDSAVKRESEKIVEILKGPQWGEVQHVAATRAPHFGTHWPHNCCAITQSTLLQHAGVDVPTIAGALALGKELERRGWKRIPIGQQRPGDLGSTCSDHPRPGIDHIYAVATVLSGGDMHIGDNQKYWGVLHERYTVGHGKSPTTHFLRAP